MTSSPRPPRPATSPISSTLHQPAKARGRRAARHHRRPRHLRAGRIGPRIHRGPGRTLVRVARLRRGAARGSGDPADAEAALLSPVRLEGPRHRHRPGRAADRAAARPHVEGVLQQLGLRGQRHRGEARLVLQQRARPPPEEEDHLARARLPRHHGGEREPHRHRARPTATSTCPCPAIRHADCPDYYRHGRPGESEETFATRMAESLDAQIQREDPTPSPRSSPSRSWAPAASSVPPRTYFDKVQAVLKKYDVLFIADEVICGFGRTGKMFGSETYASHARHHRHGEGAVVRLSADLRHRDLRGDLPGAPHRERQDRRLRARLHVLRSPRLLRRRARDARDHEGTRPGRAMSAHRPAAPVGAPSPRRSSARGRRARRGPDRGRRAGSRQDDTRAVRPAWIRRRHLRDERSRRTASS